MALPPRMEPAPPAPRAALVAVLLLALALRLGRAALRWDEIALAYAAYLQPWLDRAAAGDLPGVLGTFTGLHPPLYSALFGLVDALWGAPAAWLGLSAALSAAAVWWVGRAGGALAALVLAVDPLQLAYAAELNNYPLLSALCAACWWQRERVGQGASPWGLGLVGVAAGWTHLLGGLWAGLCVLSLLRVAPRAAAALLGALALGCAPVLVGVARLAGQEGTWAQPGLELGVVAAGLGQKLGPWGLVWGLALLGALRRPALLGVLVGGAGGIGLALALGAAAPHQQPYWLLLGPVQALAVARLPRVLGGLALGLGVAGLGPELGRGRELLRALEEPRAVELALEQSDPDDALWLLAPGLEPDDDKTAWSDVLWRLPVLGRAPAWRGPEGTPAFEYTDYGFGQPRRLAGRVVHTSTDLWPERFDAALGWHLDAGRRVWVVLYDHAPAFDYVGKLDRALRPYAHRCAAVGPERPLGQDHLCVVEGRR